MVHSKHFTFPFSFFKWLQELITISLQILSTLLVESSFFCQYSEVSQRSFQLVSKPSEVPSHNWHLCEAESHFKIWAAERSTSWPFSPMAVELRENKHWTSSRRVTLCNTEDRCCRCFVDVFFIKKQNNTQRYLCECVTCRLNGIIKPPICSLKMMKSWKWTGPKSGENTEEWPDRLRAGPTNRTRPSRSSTSHYDPGDEAHGTRMPHDSATLTLSCYPWLCSSSPKERNRIPKRWFSQTREGPADTWSRSVLIKNRPRTATREGATQPRAA